MASLAELTDCKLNDESFFLSASSDCEEDKDMTNIKLELIKILVEKSLKVSKDPIYPLASGKLSDFYIDCKETTLYSRGLYLIGQIIFNKIELLKINGIGGLTLGADSIANATAIVAGQKGIDLISFVIRKEVKSHGLKKWIEGGINPGDKVVIIDDVITTGGSTIQAIERAENFGLEIVKVIVLVDREEGGKNNIQNKGYELESIFTKTELMKEYDKFVE